MMTILPSFMHFSRSIVDLGLPTIWRIMGEDKNCPTLLRIGDVASVISWGDIRSNSLSQKFFKTGSCKSRTIFLRKIGSVRSGGTIIKVEFGTSTRVRIAFLKIYSSLGPQEWA